MAKGPEAPEAAGHGRSQALGAADARSDAGSGHRRRRRRSGPSNDSVRTAPDALPPGTPCAGGGGGGGGGSGGGGGGGGGGGQPAPADAGAPALAAFGLGANGVQRALLELHAPGAPFHGAARAEAAAQRRRRRRQGQLRQREKELDRGQGSGSGEDSGGSRGCSGDSSGDEASGDGGGGGGGGGGEEAVSLRAERRRAAAAAAAAARAEAHAAAAEERVHARLLALPGVPCVAANGELFMLRSEMVREIILRRHFEGLGVELEEYAAAASALSRTSTGPASELGAPTARQQPSHAGAGGSRSLRPTCSAALGSSYSLLSRAASGHGSLQPSRPSGIGAAQQRGAGPGPAAGAGADSGPATTPSRARASAVGFKPQGAGGGGGGPRRSAIGRALDAGAAAGDGGASAAAQAAADEEVLRRVEDTEARVEQLRAALERRAAEARAAKLGGGAASKAGGGGGGGEAQQAGGGAAFGAGWQRGGAAGPSGGGGRARARAERRAAARAALGFGGWPTDGALSDGGGGGGSGRRRSEHDEDLLLLEGFGDSPAGTGGGAGGAAGSAAGTVSDGGGGGRGGASWAAGPIAGRHWERAARFVRANVANWQAHRRAAERFKDAPRALGWSDVIRLGDVYVKASPGGGGAVYIAKCAELGLRPVSQVLQQLPGPSASLARCSLGGPAAAALGAALAANTCLGALDLRDNGMDAAALSDVLTGLCTATGARLTPRTRQRQLDLAQESFGLIAKRALLDACICMHAPGALPLAGAGASGGGARGSAPGGSGGGGGGSAGPASPSRPSRPVTFAGGSPAGSAAAEEAAAAEAVAKAAAAAAADQEAPLPSVRRRPGAPATSKAGAASASAAVSRSGSMRGHAPRPSIFSCLSDLDLSDNPLGLAGAKLIADLLRPERTPWQFLERLSLSRCGLTEAGGCEIAGALRAGNVRLRALALARNGLGNASACLFGEVLESGHTLRELDLGWNQIRAAGARGLARGLSANASLSRLVLAWNGLGDAGGGAVGEALGLNLGLRWLDLSHCRLGEEACLLISRGLKANSGLETLLLDGNPVGEGGARHLVSALGSNEALQHLGLAGCNLSASAADAESAGRGFDPAAPEGRYRFDLSAPAQRAAAAALCELDAAAAADLMRGISLDGKPIASCKKAGWPSSLPARGALEFEFTLRKAARPLVAMDARKFAALRRQFTSPALSDRERLGLVHAVADLLSSFGAGPERAAAAALLYTRATAAERPTADGGGPGVSGSGGGSGADGGGAGQTPADAWAEGVAAIEAALGPRDATAWRQALGWAAGQPWSAPTGHYELDLSRPIHRAVAARLKDAALAGPEGPCWINLLHDDPPSEPRRVPSGHGPPDDMRAAMPSRGALSLDFLSLSAPPEGAVPLSDEAFARLLRDKVGIAFEPPPAPGEPPPPRPAPDAGTADAQAAALRRAAAGLVVSSAQARFVARECFALSPHRVEAAVVLFPCAVDRGEAYWTVHYALSGLEQSLLAARLGPSALFNPRRPSAHWVLDARAPGHADVARRLVAAAAASGELPNIWNLRLRGVRRAANENANLWGGLTADSPTPHLEFDYAGADAWDAAGLAPAAVAGMRAGDRLEARARQAARLESVRARQLHPYFPAAARHAWPGRREWECHAALVAPQADKAPWLAAWDRQIRSLLRLELSARAAAGDPGGTPLGDAFAAASDGGDELAPVAFEQLLRSWGYARGEVQALLRGAAAVLNPPEPAAAAAGGGGDAAGARADSGGGQQSSRGGGSSGGGGAQAEAAAGSGAARFRGGWGAAAAAVLGPSAGGAGTGGEGGGGAGGGDSSTAERGPSAGGQREGSSAARQRSPPKAAAQQPAAPAGRQPSAGASRAAAAAAAAARLASSSGDGGGGAATAAPSRPASSGANVPSQLALQIEASAPRGLTLPEFLALVMPDPPKATTAARAREVAAGAVAALLAGGGGGGGGGGAGGGAGAEARGG
ncbi:hypothetical protein Rsub_07797 [Raphidocelis subcapitata]|uniref:Flagellar associated protein n=1 Tax=Raphidocelis subcapitata TaxID=307507 RepID=A0A2V0P728_9CHLO|nr:hypothetical protein Rsub_07797 [Raphidocelis subcapitata]|eukprot:GBF95369.1 hypothetical protein Rsub_07797 [Raphidocelis subcapitata]